MIKIQEYAVAFSHADPDPATRLKWHAGLTFDYKGINPFKLPGKSNSKDVWAMYYPTEGGVIPYKLYEVDDDNDAKRIPAPVPFLVRVRRDDPDLVLYYKPIGSFIYADYYARTAVRNVALYETVGLVTVAGIATLNTAMGGH